MVRKEAKTMKLPSWYKAWQDWYLGLGPYAGHKRDPKLRPKAPYPIPKWAWPLLHAKRLSLVVKKPKPAPANARERALAHNRDLIGVCESGPANAGAIVEEIQRADTLPGSVYAWCQATQNYAWRLATGATRVYDRQAKLWNLKGGKMLAEGTASVPQFVAWARSKRYIITGRPLAADHVAFIGSDGVPYHVGQIETVVRIVGIWLYLNTIEGNTGTANDLSHVQSPRDAVRRKRRVVRRSSVVIVRVLGA